MQTINKSVYLHNCMHVTAVSSEEKHTEVNQVLALSLQMFAL